jgi:hypothetical protein
VGIDNRIAAPLPASVAATRRFRNGEHNTACCDFKGMFRFVLFRGHRGPSSGGSKRTR